VSRWALAVLCAGALSAFPACSIKKLAVNSLGNALAKGGDTYASDDDPELVRQAIPFALKTIESLLAESPRHEGLLLAAASGFTQYSFAFVQADADVAEGTDLAKATELRRRALRLYKRALGYGLRGLAVRHDGFERRLRAGDAVLKEATREDVPLLYWTAAAWAAAISIAKDDAELAADLAVVEVLMRRALELDEGFAAGSIHDFFIAYEGARPPAAGGSPEKARQHLERALALSGGNRAAPLVSYAESVLIAKQDRKEFESTLNRALAVDADKVPEQRLANLVAQRRARWLLSRADELFVD